MKTFKFKTTINCGGCVATVTPHLNQHPDITSWDADINSPDKILTVESENLQAQEIRSVIEKLGFKADLIS